ncbi:MAG: T9SS type A sorting domain-containing protein [Flavobacteriales bacterium]
MKNILFISSIFLGLVLKAQVIPLYPQDGLNRFTPINPANSGELRGAQIKKWFNYGEVYAMSPNGSSSQFYISDFIFPDTARFDYTDGIGRSFYYKVASVTSPTASTFTTFWDTDFSKHLPYYVDSVRIPFRYHRKSKSDVVDTLVIEVGSDSSAVIAALSGSDIINSFGVNSVSFDHLKFKAGADGIGEMELPRKTTLKVLLDTDFVSLGTTLDLLELKLPVNLPRFRAGENVFVALKFVPGFSYNPNDTITRSGNTFQTTMWQEEGANSFPLYYEDELNCSYFANYLNLLPITNSQMYEAFYAYYWVNVWPIQVPEHFDFGVKMRYDETWLGINTNEGKTSANCFPNPVSDKAIISYSVAENENIKISLFDINGQLIFEREEGNKTKGVYFSELDLTDLNSGIYLYTVGNSKLGKLIVQ